MEPYRHTQSGRAIVIALGAAALFCVAIAAYFSSSVFALLIGSLMAACAWLFSSLTVEIDDERIRWLFGPGIIRKQLNLNEIQHVSTVRTSWYDGWGIHYTKNGWLYNVAGRDAVAIQLTSGKRLALGTDQPDALAGALSARL